MLDKEVYSTALKNTLDEMRNACPDIQNAFMFTETGEILAGDADTPEKVMVRVIDAFDGIMERAEAIGGIESVTIEGGKGTVTLSHFGENYFVTVTSEKADMKYVGTLTRVLIPTVLRVLEKLSPTLTKKASPTLPKPAAEVETEPELLKVKEEPVEEHAEETEIEEPSEEAKPEPEPTEPTPETLPTEPTPETLPIEPQATQLIVENLGGLLVSSDTVRIDNEMLSEWENTFGGKPVELVDIETFDGKTLRCKVKPIKDSKYNGKGVVQMPEKVQLTLEIKKGELVRVKPVFE
jgi:predicted regulator of Ras-like GTPase activity (Roadblock/LC7/MglB family)